MLGGLDYPGVDGILEAGKMRSPCTPVSLRLRKWTTDSGYGDASCFAFENSLHARVCHWSRWHWRRAAHNYTTLQVHFDLHELQYLAYWLDLI